MKTVLVTGAAGFLGSHLAMHHLRIGDNVIGVDNFCSSDEDSDHLKMLRSFEQLGTFKFIEEDVCTDFKNWLDLTKHIDLIYNFACPASPPVYQSMPIGTMMTCTVGTANMLDLASVHKSVVVHASTSEVYGDPFLTPQHETYRGCVNSYGPRACYDEGKRAAEALCYDYLNSYDVDARLVRIFNTYGPNMDPHDGRVVSNFICQALSGEPLTVYGEGNQTRSFCYVDDLIRGIVAMGALPNNPGTPINLGNPDEFTILDLATNVAEIIGVKKVKLKFEPLPQDDPRQRKPSIEEAMHRLDWKPKVQLGDGLAKTIEYFRKVVSP